jgi:outer membrane receptor protein involved in Fe transport
MTRKIMNIVLVLMMIPALLFAGTTGKIAGKVTDKQTGLPLPGANVMIRGTSIGAAANMNGEYFILSITPGTYTVEATMIGYSALIQTEVSIRVDLTTPLNFALNSEVLDMGQTVTIVADRPLIQKDLTASRKIASAEEVMAAPVEDVQGAVELTAGVAGNNFRGGRAGEAMYTLDGVALVDPMTGTFESDVPLMSLEEVSVMTGGFSAEYGNIQSGLVSMVTKEGGSEYHGGLRYKTNDLGNADLNKSIGHHYTTLKDMRDNNMFIDNFSRAENLKNFEWSIGGPEPITTYLFKKPDKLNFFFGGEVFDNTGRFPGQADKKGSLNGKLAFRPTSGIKVALTGMKTWRHQNFYYHGYKNTTYESLIDSTKEWDVNNIIKGGTYDATKVVARDYNGDGDTNDIIDGRDLNHNGFIGDELSMLDNVEYQEDNTDEFSLSLTHPLRAKTFYEVKLSRYMTKMHYNVNERINEDLNGDGIFDSKTEDLNGNGIWDWQVYGAKTDIFVDDNNNGFIDASENNSRDKWIPWKEIPFGRYQDTESFYWYGIAPNLSYNRNRWNNDIKTTYSAKVDFTSQITNRQQIKAGFSWDYFDLFDYDVDMASGGNVYGQNIHVYPNSGALYVQDKMEYEGMIVNLGMRMDYFDANFDNYPSDLENPVPDSIKTVGGIIHDPTSVESKYYWSPRLGVAFPFSEKDLIHFSYGKYFQRPMLRLLFTNINYDFSGAFPIIGNPALDPERTTGYEIGWKHQFTTDIVLNFTGYYKDITGLVDIRQVYYDYSNWYGLYYNTDYANIRGFELELYKRRSPSGFVAGTVNYVFSVAKGKSSDQRQNYENVWAGDLIPTTESYLDWDERHVVKANLDLRVPYHRNLFGTSIFDDMGLNLVYSFGSGRPYSPPKHSKEVPINTKRLPFTTSVDVTFDKRFDLGAKRSVTFFVWVINLLDRQNFNTVTDVTWYDNYSKVQKAYEDGTMDRATYMSIMDAQDPSDLDGDKNYNEADGAVDYNKSHPEMGKNLDPTVYDRSRTIRFGLSFEF